jgi:hypothetical protein
MRVRGKWVIELVTCAGYCWNEIRQDWILWRFVFDGDPIVGASFYSDEAACRARCDELNALEALSW